MKLAPPGNRDGVTPARVALALFLCALIPLLAYAAAPAWWSQRGVLNDNVAADDYATANQGQLKNIANAAVAEMDANLPGGAGERLHQIIAQWPATGSDTNDFAPLNLGQLKTIAKPFYDRLIEVKYASKYPWIESGDIPDDFAVANVGQVKNAFAFDFATTDLAHDTDQNGLPDWWEQYFFGRIGNDPYAITARGDEVTNIEAFQQHLDPINAGEFFTITPGRLDEVVATGQTVSRTLKITNATASTQQVTFNPHSTPAIVHYIYTDSDKENGPQFIWNDISGTGVHLDVVSDADEAFEPLPLSFSFPFYTESYSSAYVSSNGFITFGAGSNDVWARSYPNRFSPAAIVAPFEDDLDLAASGDVYYQDYGDRVVIQFQNAARYYKDGYVTFQIELHRDGTIFFYYKDMLGIVDEATVGMQNASRTEGLTIAWFQPYLKSNLAVRIDAIPTWPSAPWLHISPTAAALASGASTDLSITFDARNLSPGRLSGAVTISTDDNSIRPIDIPVTMTVVDDTQLDDDNDGLTNARERMLGSDPTNIDSDRDGMPDGWEVAHGLDPLTNDAGNDPDGDGSTNLQEYQRHTDPNDYFNGEIPVIDIVSGNNQFGEAGTFASRPLTVRVHNRAGRPYNNALVTFTVTSGFGELAATNGSASQGSQMSVRAGSDGQASAAFALSNVSGQSSRITAVIHAPNNSISAVFRAVSVYRYPAPVTTTPPQGGGPSPTATPSPPAAPPYRYAIVDLGPGTSPIRVNNKGSVLMTGQYTSSGYYYRWKDGASEVLTNPDPSQNYTAVDMNDDDVVVGWGGNGRDDFSNNWSTGINDFQRGLVWPAGNTLPNKLPGPVMPFWAPTLGLSVQECFVSAIANNGDMYGGAYTGDGAFARRQYGLRFQQDILNAQRWSADSLTRAALSFSRSIANWEGFLWLFNWHGALDYVTRANASGHYIGQSLVPGPVVDYMNMFSSSGMVDGQQVDFQPTDIDEAGIIVGYQDSNMFIRAPGSADQVLAGAHDLYPIAINDHVLAMVNGTSTTPDTSPAPQILGSDGHITILWERQSDGTWYPFGLEEMIPNLDGWEISYATDMNDMGVIVGNGRFTDPANPQAQSENHGFMLVPLALIVDGNRDGQMSLDDADDTTSNERPYRFWLNDDDDTTGGNNNIETVPSVQRDCDRHAIISHRNLEDFSRLWINLGGIADAVHDGRIQIGLRWRNATDHPGMNIYPSFDGNGSMSYLTDTTAADNQVADADFNKAIVGVENVSTVNGGDGIHPTFVFKKDYWSLLSHTNPTKCFLFEGASEGKGELEIVLFDNPASGQPHEIGSGGSAWLELKSIKRMYERWSVDPGSDVPDTGATPSPTARLSPRGDNAGFAYDAHGPEELEYITFVHGWNVRPLDKDSAAETAYKRLFWQGYKGRFAAFQWPTTWGFDGKADVAKRPRGFDEGEYVAWRSGAPLAELLQRLNGLTPGRVYLFAHSLGNVVAGEAIRLLGRVGAPINTYVACHAALAAEMYDPQIANQFPLVFPLATDSDTPDTYPNWLKTAEAGVESKVNFFNENDWALSPSIWELDQALKPDVSIFGITYGWGPPGNLNIFAGDDRFWSFAQGTLQLDLGDQADVRDRYEIMSYAAEARSRALGRVPAHIAGFGSNGDAVHDMPGDGMWGSDPFGNRFKDRVWHSGEFEFTNMQVGSFWSSLLEAFGIPSR